MRVLVAPDKFKGSLTAVEVARELARGIRSAGGVAVELPLADGGDGSVDAAVAAGSRRHTVEVPDALGRVHSADFAFEGVTAVIEVASTCGLQLLGADRAPLEASSAGLGAALRTVLTHSPRRVVLALGGSASTDGGAGFLTALGARLLDARGHALAPGGGHLSELDLVDLSGLVDLGNTELVMASDVTNPLLGPDGAAAVFAPQKGASPRDVSVLESGLARYLEVLTRARPTARELATRAGAGSAGGLGLAALLLGARAVSGAQYFMDELNFAGSQQGVGLVVTGEGQLDEQSGRGKLVAEVARRSAPTPVEAVVGRSRLTPRDWPSLGLQRVHSLAERTETDTSSDAGLSAELLVRIGAEIASRG